MRARFPQFRKLIIIPTLQQLGMYSKAAENLVYGTALAESDLSYLKQMGQGPALSFWQIEPATFRDVKRYLGRRLDIRDRLVPMVADRSLSAEELVSNLKLACAVCRLKFYMSPDPLPAADDWVGLAEYWKEIYNTHLGKGTVEHFLKATKHLRKD